MADDPAVVFMHFATTWKVVNPAFGAEDRLAPYFHPNLEYLMGAAAPVWVYGHNHYSMTDIVEQDCSTTLMASEQLGCPREIAGFVPDDV